MPYPEQKPSGNYALRDYDFAVNDTKKIPMDEYLFKNGYKNADESKLESVPDAHNTNWLYDILHRNLKYTLETAEENKNLLANKVATPTSIGQIKVGYGLTVTSNGVLSVDKGVAEDANIISYDLPVGSYMLWCGKNTPEYFIEPDGRTLLRSSYPDLYEFAESNELIGSSNTYESGKLFGPGDGSTTFVVYDIRGQFIKISNATNLVATSETAGLPNITGEFGADDRQTSVLNGCFYRGGSGYGTGSSGTESGWSIKFDASRANSIYGKSNTVTPQNISLKLILKAKPTPPSNAVPTGTILDYTGKEAPDGYIIANGAELSRTTFSRLYSWALSNSLTIEQSLIPSSAHGFYGTGNGSTTFTIPDLRGVFKRNADLASNRGGSELGVYQDDGLPNIEGEIGGNCGFQIGTGSYTANGCFEKGTAWSRQNESWGDQGKTIAFDASNSNPIYGASSQVQPKSVSVIPILKY